MTADSKSPKADALRAMREANYEADAPKGLLRKPLADLRAAAKEAAERVGRQRELKVPLRDPKPKVRTPLSDEERERRKVKRENREAKKAGGAAMPLVGKAADAAIAAVRKQKPDLGDQRSTAMAKTSKTKKTASKSKTKPAKPRAESAAKPASSARKNRYDWGVAEEKAAAGHVPPPMDFTAECHAPYRDRKTELENLAKDGGVAELKAIKIPTYNSTSRSLGRWRDLAVAALTKKAAA